MYEIWLTLNVIWEIALEILPLLIAGAVLWAMLMAAALLAGDGRLRNGTRPALAAGLAAMVLAGLLLPGWTDSSLGEMGYWVDWVALLGISVSFGAAATLLAWPLAALGRRRRA